MPRSRPLTPLADLLPKVLKEMRSDRLDKETVEMVWRRLVGEKAARYSRPRRLNRRRLVVEVDNSGWMYTLGLKKDRLLIGLIELLGVGRVKSLTFRIGEGKNA